MSDRQYLPQGVLRYVLARYLPVEFIGKFVGETDDITVTTTCRHIEPEVATCHLDPCGITVGKGVHVEFFGTEHRGRVPDRDIAYEAVDLVVVLHIAGNIHVSAERSGERGFGKSHSIEIGIDEFAGKSGFQVFPSEECIQRNIASKQPVGTVDGGVYDTVAEIQRRRCSGQINVFVSELGNLRIGRQVCRLGKDVRSRPFHLYSGTERCDIHARQELPQRHIVSNNRSIVCHVVHIANAVERHPTATVRQAEVGFV